MEILGQVAPALQVFLDRRWLESDSYDGVMNASVEAAAGCEETPAPQDVQVTNEVINDPEKQTAILGAVSLPPGANASLYLGLSLAFPWDVATIFAFFPRRD